jgi:hypothetical protein
VTFYVGGQRMRNTGVWDNNHLAPLDLAPSNLGQHYVYLPLVRH